MTLASDAAGDPEAIGSSECDKELLAEKQVSGDLEFAPLTAGFVPPNGMFAKALGVPCARRYLLNCFRATSLKKTMSLSLWF